MRSRQQRLKKKQRVVLPRSPRRRLEALADEPVFDHVVGPADSGLIRALNYYNYLDLVGKSALQREWTLEYVRSHGFTPDEVEAVSRMEDWRISTAIASISRMVNRGVSLDPSILDGHDRRIRDEVESYRRRLETRAAERRRGPDELGGPHLDRSTELKNHHIGHVEEMLDRFVTGGFSEPFSTYDYLVRSDAPQAVARGVADYYRPKLEEMRRAKRSEGFHLKTSEINSLVDQLSSIIDEADRYAGNKRVSKPRQKKLPDASKLVRNLRYLSGHSDLKLVSVDPTKIIGATTVWLYNVKYKQLRRLTGDSLTVSGSTIKDYDPDRSEGRILRHPEEVLKRVLSGTSRTLPRVFDDVRTKPIQVNGRVNSDTIILRTI